jgi:hypothetical protein
VALCTAAVRRAGIVMLCALISKELGDLAGFGLLWKSVICILQ